MANPNFKFKVVEETDNYVFISLCIDDVDQLSHECFNYFFDEANCFNYFNSLEVDSIFEPTKENFATLYRCLSMFIDDDIDGIRNDKVGKLGEYFLSILLADYFEYNCVYPKLLSVTSNNMPVFGRDVIYYQQSKNLLMLGEAKLTDSLSDGIQQIEKSLAEYENKLDNDYTFIFNNKDAIIRSNPNFITIFGNSANAINFKEFLDKAGFSEIGVPLFICHGVETDKDTIISKLKSIKKIEKILDFPVKYMCVSLPINGKEKFLVKLKVLLKEKKEEYESLRRQPND